MRKLLSLMIFCLALSPVARAEGQSWVGFTPTFDSTGKIVRQAIERVWVYRGQAVIAAHTWSGANLIAIFDLGTVEANACYQMALSLASSRGPQGFVVGSNITVETIPAPPPREPLPGEPPLPPGVPTYKYTVAVDKDFNCELQSSF
jgi:hypothetical protein